MQTLQILRRFVQISLEIADTSLFFVDKVFFRFIGLKFGQADFNHARLYQFVIVFAHFVQPSLNLGTNFFFQTALIDVTDNIQTFAHKRTVFFLQNRHLF